jgi:small subunit ribosomal protein S7
MAETESAETKPTEAVMEAATPAVAQEEKKAEPKRRRRSGSKEEGATQSGSALFEKYPVEEIKVLDSSVVDYINPSGRSYPNIFGRRKHGAYYDTHISVTERLINKLMRGGTGKKVGGKVIRTKGRLQGKKLKVMHIVEDAFEIINKRTGKNPLQVLVNAIENAAPIEDTTRVRYGGISYNVAVGISSKRRVDVALRNIALASLTSAFKKRKKLSEALADELMLASDKAPDSYAIKKRIEAERIARRAR